MEALLPATFDTNQTTCWIPNLVRCSAAETFDAREVLVWFLHVGWFNDGVTSITGLKAACVVENDERSHASP